MTRALKLVAPVGYLRCPSPKGILFNASHCQSSSRVVPVPSAAQTQDERSRPLPCRRKTKKRRQMHKNKNVYTRLPACPACPPCMLISTPMQPVQADLFCTSKCCRPMLPIHHSPEPSLHEHTVAVRLSACSRAAAATHASLFLLPLAARARVSSSSSSSGGASIGQTAAP